MRAREYDPETGRFLEVDPKEQETGESDLSSYLYAEDDPTLLTDPSGLDPSFHGKTLNYKKNFDLCRFIYGSGYRDGCEGEVLRSALTNLYKLGIEFQDVLDSANGKAKLVWSNGSKGLGFYFVRYGNGATERLRSPYNPRCGWVCSVGFVSTQVLGCGSVAGCVVRGALFFTPTPAGKGTRLMERYSWLMKLLGIERKAERVEEGVKGAAEVVRGIETAEDLAGRSIDELLKAGTVPDRNGLTRAGRALQKHGDRSGSVFPRSSGTAAERNAQGQKVLSEILHTPTRVANRGGGVFDIYSKGGRGARFNRSGFIGFRE
jgi:hypothetical protein